MFSSLGTMQSIRYFPTGPETQSFSSFPSSLVCRYDLYYDYGRQTSAGVNVTTDGLHIYQILDKSGNGYHMISKSTEATPANKLVLNGLGLNKPCVMCDSYATNNNPTTTGYSTQSTHPQFTNGFEVICVMRPLATSTIAQNLLVKYSGALSYPYPFAITWLRAVGTGSSQTTWTAGVNVRQTLSTAVIMGTRFFKSNSIGYERSNGADVSNSGTLSGYNYTDVSTNPLGLCYRSNNPAQQVQYEVGEVLMFNAELTTAQREQMEGYLASKWGITLASGHTYANINVRYNGTNQ